MGLFIHLRQRYCKHNYRKRWSRENGGYVKRCTKCNKVVSYER
nr:MAG TPA: General transcription and DNA repair, Helicase, Translocase, DNA repair.5A [Caudoviricetes sp.]